MLKTLEDIILMVRERKTKPQSESYTNKLLNCGADKVSINTAAVESSKVVVDSSKKFGSQCIVVAIDAKKNGDKWEVFTHGGRNNSGIDALEYAKKMEDSGAGELLVTSMDRDGTQVGYDIELMSKISSKVNIPLIASVGFDPTTFGLWAQHASPAPRCFYTLT